MVIKVKTEGSEEPNRHIADDIRFKTDDLMTVVRDVDPGTDEEELIAVREYNWDHVVWFEKKE
jgi:hypothetical protein